MLFDMIEDPNELVDLGACEAEEHKAICQLMNERIFTWARQHHNRTTMPFPRLKEMENWEPPGIMIGVYDEEDYEKTFDHPYSERP